MADLVRGEANSATNPRVLFAWQSANVGDSGSGMQLKGGFFQPFDSVSFRILYPDGTEYIGMTAIDLGFDPSFLDPVSEGGKGRILIPPFTVDLAEPTGSYFIEVTFVAHPEGGAPLPAQTVTYPFRVVDEDLGLVDGAYAQFTDMLAAGFPIGDPAPTCGGFSLVDARRALLRASRYIEEITSRVFDPRYRVFDLDGKGGSIIQTHHAIIGLTDVAFTFTTFTPADLPIEEGDLRVYNRHIRQSLLEPDDRQDPRIEFLRTPNYRFPRDQLYGDTDLLSGNVGFVDSQQNVKCSGVWGYTDPDASPFGKTPELITEACLRLAARYIQPLWKQIGGAGQNAGAAGPILMEKTLDQQVKFSDVATSGTGAGAFTGAFTGDPEVDQILALYMAPPKFGSA